VVQFGVLFVQVDCSQKVYLFTFLLRFGKVFSRLEALANTFALQEKTAT
jgi:hypothetical protein